MKYKIIIPVLNGGEIWKKCIASLLNQGINANDVIVIDSGSNDGSLELAEESGFFAVEINKSEFNHGRTRQNALKYAKDADVVVYMTQDAVLASPDSIHILVSVFEDKSVGSAFGRQLPREGAGVIESHARIFNYPDVSYKRRYDDKTKYGMKTAFISNSFAAYSIKALEDVGGFPGDVILGEDAFVAAKMLKTGYIHAYQAEATVYHSHSYTLIEEFKRYFDTGVFHKQNQWILNEFGKPEGEGLRYIKSELGFVLKNAPLQIIKSMASHWFKYLGYSLGKNESVIPVAIKRHLSMHKVYWQQSN